MPTPANARAFFLWMAAIAFGLVAYALILQHAQGLPPCPLCILQRFAFLGVGVLATLAALHPSAWRLWRGLGALCALCGAGVAGYHVWLVLKPTASCGIDPIENWVNALPTARWLPQIFEADGLCAGPMPPVLGLPVPVWSLIWLAALAAAMMQRRAPPD